MLAASRIAIEGVDPEIDAGRFPAKTIVDAGSVFAVDLVFHNAYGPDKTWFYDKALSGGGCVMDLGVHLADLALWCLDFPAVLKVESRIFGDGVPLAWGSDQVEDFAVATVHLETGTVIRLTCSWRLHAGCDAIIEARFYGTEGGARLCNVGGSFYDFTAEASRGTQSEVLAAPRTSGAAAPVWNGQDVSRRAKDTTPLARR